MRIIDADEFEKFIEQKYSDSERTDNIKDQITFDLSCQQTVFDLEKIVKQLEEIKLMHLRRGDLVGYASFKRAIEIVKSGGVNNKEYFVINDKNKIKELESLSVDEKLRERSQKVIEKYKMRSGGDN